MAEQTMSNDDKFYDLALKITTCRACNRDGCAWDEGVYCSECRHMASHIATEMRKLVRAETERCIAAVRANAPREDSKTSTAEDALCFRVIRDIRDGAV